MRPPLKDLRFEPFHELEALDVYEVLKLRAQIFVVEQSCVYLDPDDIDLDSFHLLLREQGRLIAYLRCVPPGVSYPAESSLGRIVVCTSQRGRELGRALVREGIERNFELWPQAAIKISAQAYLQGFYESLGFCSCSSIYLEDGIEHLAMMISSTGRD
ncbi:MAG: GNAT family N-acetyltransferase [Pseudomonadota bacterium]